MTTSPNDPAELAPARGRTVLAHLAGIEHDERGATLWLSDEVTTVHFPLTRATVPPLLAQLQQVEIPRPDDDDLAPEHEQEQEEEEPGRMARWTGWHYSNTLVRRLPPQQRIALFAAVLVILLLVTLFTRY